MISPRITEVIISFSENQPAYEEMKQLDPRVTAVSEFDYNALGSNYTSSTPCNTLVILDDQMNSAMNNRNIQDLFTKGVHHRSISAILVTQDLFPTEKFARTIRRNANYMLIFKSPTFRSQVNTFGVQLFPDKKGFLTSAYCKATEKPYTYLFINLHPNCPDMLRIRSGILPMEDLTIYIPV